MLYRDRAIDLTASAAVLMIILIGDGHQGLPD